MCLHSIQRDNFTSPLHTFSSDNQIINFIGGFLTSKDSVLLECYSQSEGSWFQMFQRNKLLSLSRIKESNKHSMTASLKIWRVYSFRTSGINNPFTQHNKPEDLKPQHQQCENLVSCLVNTY